MLFVEVTVKTVRVSDWKSLATSIRKNRINTEREGAKFGQEHQAQKIAALSNSRLPAVDIGTNVVVSVPDLDWGRLAPDVLAVFVHVSSSGLYLLGTNEGLLERPYVRTEFTTSDNTFIEALDVHSSSLSLLSASMITSGNKQGFVSCHCKSYCIDKKCKCRSKNIMCNSKCHCNSSRNNKWASPSFFISLRYMYFYQ